MLMNEIKYYPVFMVYLRNRVEPLEIHSRSSHKKTLDQKTIDAQGVNTVCHDLLNDFMEMFPFKGDFISFENFILRSEDVVAIEVTLAAFD